MAGVSRGNARYAESFRLGQGCSDAVVVSDWRTGVAAGSGRSILDIIALNVRTEIAFGRFSDGCTSLAWHTEKRAYLGQNWDVSQTCPLQSSRVQA